MRIVTRTYAYGYTHIRVWLYAYIRINTHVASKCLLSEFSVLSLRSISLKKLYLWLYLTQIIYSNGIMLLDEKIVYQSFNDAPLQGKVLCFGSRVGKSLARCLYKVFRRPCRKIISLVIFDTDRSFKQ